jgi:hypothetical protein
MVKIYNTCLLPSREGVEAILDSIQPSLTDQQREIAKLMIRDYESFIRSTTFALSDKEIAFDSSWITGEIHLDDLSASAEIKAQFVDASESDSCGQVLEKITELYRHSFQSTWLKSRIDADVVVNNFREERIQRQWPAARQIEIQASVFDEISRVKSGKIKAREMFQDVSEGPPADFRSRFDGW